MALKVKKFTKATFNYTNRRKISLKHCHVEIPLQQPGEFRVDLILEIDQINVEEGQTLVFEAFHNILYDRISLEDPKEKENIYLEGFPSDSNPSFRLKVIGSSNENNGRIFSSTTVFKARTQDDEINDDVAFLEYSTSSDIGDQIWFIDWTERLNPAILVNLEFEEKVSLKTDKDAQAYIYPIIVREILGGIYRAIKIEGWTSFEQIDETSGVGRWLHFCEQRLEISMPEGEGWGDSEEWECFIDSCLRRFCDKEWIGGKSLFRRMVGK